MGGDSIGSVDMDSFLMVGPIQRLSKQFSPNFSTIQCHQELIDPLRGVLARMIADITPGDLKYSFFWKWYRGKWGQSSSQRCIPRNQDLSAVKGFNGKTMGSLSIIGEKRISRACWSTLWQPVYHVPFGDADAVWETTWNLWNDMSRDCFQWSWSQIQGEAGAMVPPNNYCSIWSLATEIWSTSHCWWSTDRNRSNREDVGSGSLVSSTWYSDWESPRWWCDANISIRIHWSNMAMYDASESIYPYDNNRWWSTGLLSCYGMTPYRLFTG